MSNMSYCRFQNTLSDLRDCYHALQDGAAEELSAEETRARDSLIELCRSVTEDFGDTIEERSRE